MSHFTVLVAANDEADLRGKLLPFHEYESTGIEEYTIWIDEHDNHIEAYQTGTVEAVWYGNRLVGTKYHQENPEIKSMWQREGIGISSNDRFVLRAGYEVRETPFTVVYPSLEGFMQDWHGYGPNHRDAQTGRYGRRTNPNSKWDWYSVGGRYTGTLMLKPVPAGYAQCGHCLTMQKPGLIAVCKQCGAPLDMSSYVPPDTIKKQTGNGEGGAFNRPNQNPNRADWAPAGVVDWDRMLEEHLEYKMTDWRNYHSAMEVARVAVTDGLPADQVETYSSEYHEEGERGEYIRAAFGSLDDCILMKQTMAVLRQRRQEPWATFGALANLHYLSLDEYRDLFANDPLTFAFIDKHGAWQQQAEMGWWGITDPEGATDGYGANWWHFVRGLPTEQRVYVVDCHI